MITWIIYFYCIDNTQRYWTGTDWIDNINKAKLFLTEEEAKKELNSGFISEH